MDSLRAFSYTWAHTSHGWGLVAFLSTLETSTCHTAAAKQVPWKRHFKPRTQQKIDCQRPENPVWSTWLRMRSCELQESMRAGLLVFFNTVKQILLIFAPTNLDGLTWWLSGKESACRAGHVGCIPGSGRSPGEVNGNLLQYSYLGNLMDRGIKLQFTGSQRVRHELATKHHHQSQEVKENEAKTQTETKWLIYALWLDFQIKWEEPYVKVFLKRGIYWWKSTDTGEIWWDSSSNW